MDLTQDREESRPGSADRPHLTWFGVPVFTTAAGRSVLFRAERPFQLLAYLAHRRIFVTRDELAALFFPDRPIASARTNLRKVLFLAQRIDGLLLVEHQEDRVRWLPPSDLMTLEEAAAAGRHAEVLDLYRPPLFDGLEGGLPTESAGWIGFERQRVEGLWHAAAAANLTALADQPTNAALLAERILAVDASDEVAARALGAACLVLGQPQRALRALDLCASRLADDYGIGMPAALRTLERRLRGDASDEIPPAAVLNDFASSGRLSAEIREDGRKPHDFFVGRRQELLEMDRFLADPQCRVVTVLGPGGIGKSRFVEAVCRHFNGRAGRLEAVATGLEHTETVVEAGANLASALGLELTGNDPWQRLTSHLAQRQILLVLDNAENLVDRGLGPALALLLEAAPKVKIVAASRVRLFHADERVLPLGGLPLPDADEIDPDVLRANDAVTLFEQRARAAVSTFDLGAHAADVVGLLHAVEGMPLAIELAAAWVHLLPVAEIAKDITHSLDLLDASSSKTVVRARDSSLRASFARSWERIAERERQALARLALLPGAFGRAMAKQVAEAPLPLLATLIDKSLLRTDSPGRFSVHPLLRQCVVDATGTLASAPEEPRCEDRHGLFVTEWLGESFGDQVLSREKISVFEAEYVHVRSAWDWAVDQMRPELIERGAWIVGQFFQARGRWSEGESWLRKAAVAFKSDHGPAMRARLAASVALAELQLRFSKPDAFEQSTKTVWQIAWRLRDRLALTRALHIRGLAHYRQDRPLDAKRFFQRAISQERARGNQPRVAIGLTCLGLVEGALGRYGEAASCFIESADIARHHADIQTLASALNNLASVRAALKQWNLAEIAATEALIAYEESGQLAKRCQALQLIGMARTGLGQYGSARQALEKSIALGREHEATSSVVYAALSMVDLELADHGSIAQPTALAEHYMREAIAGARRLGWRTLGIRCLTTEALRRAATGRPAEALVLGDWAARQRDVDADNLQQWQLDRSAIVSRLSGANELPPLDGSLSLDEVLQMVHHDLLHGP